jgi:hypothetical protein
MKKIDSHKSNPVAIFDWILCIVFGLLALSSLVLLLWSKDVEILITSAIGLGSLAVAYSPLINKTPLIRGLLTCITIVVLAY